MPNLFRASEPKKDRPPKPVSQSAAGYGATEASGPARPPNQAPGAGTEFDDGSEVITLLHSQSQAADAQPLLRQPSMERVGLPPADGLERGAERKKRLSRLEREFYGNSGAMEGRVRRRGGFKHFRYIVAALLILAGTLVNYANYTIYIAAIEMISNDVIQSGLTGLRAKHLAADPLASNRNAAAPGTCPKESAPPVLWPGFGGQHHQQQPEQQAGGLNASQVSTLERLALKLDTRALISSVSERLNSGQLVDWTISQRSYIFTAHNIGGILFAVPIGRLGLKFGSNWMMFICILLTGVRMLLLPLLAGHTPFWATFTFELLMGGPAGGVGILGYPLAAVWLLPDEANFFLGLAQSFALMGVAATNFVSTQLLTQHIDWCWCYYLPGALLCLLALLWLALGADRPSESRFVSGEELELLAKARSEREQSKSEVVAQSGARTHQEPNDLLGQASQRQEEYISCFCNDERERNRCPAARLERKPNWANILGCPTVWALIAVSFAYHWNAKIATLWPTFFANILHLDPSTIGIITGFKGLVALLFGSSFAFFTRKLVIRRPFGISLTAYRRINQVIATIFLGASVALMVLLDCNFWANFFSVLLTPMVTGFNTISYEQMPLDLSTEDTGLLVSVVRFVAIGDIIALPASSYILAYSPDALAGDRPTWRLVWLLGYAIKLVACLFFVLVAKSEPKSYSRLVPAGPCKSVPVSVTLSAS